MGVLVKANTNTPDEQSASLEDFPSNEDTHLAQERFVWGCV